MTWEIGDIINILEDNSCGITNCQRGDKYIIEAVTKNTCWARGKGGLFEFCYLWLGHSIEYIPYTLDKLPPMTRLFPLASQVAEIPKAAPNLPVDLDHEDYPDCYVVRMRG